MSKLGQIILKNFKELIDNKLSLFILILGPLIIISILGIYYYSDNSHSINLGIKGNEKSTLLPIYIQGFKDNGFNVITYNLEKDCEDAIKMGYVHACIIFPENFELTENKINVVRVEVDESKGKIINLIEHSIYISIETQNQKIQTQQTDMLINSVENTEKVIANVKENLSSSKEIILKLQKNNEKLKTDISELEKLYNLENLNIEDISDSISDVNKSMQSVANLSLSLTQDIKKDLSNVSTLLEDGNVSGTDISEIESLITDAKLSTTSLEKKLNSLNSDTDEVNKLVEDLADLEKELTNLETKLENKYNTLSSNAINVSKEQKSLENIVLNVDAQTSNLLSELKKIEIRDSEVLVKPVVIEVSNVSEKADNRLTAIFPSLIASLIMIISLFIASIFVLQERNSEASFRNYMAQTSGFLFLLGNFLAIFSIVFLQMSLIIFVYYLIFLKVSFAKAILVILIVIPIISFFIFLGMFIGNLSKSETVNSIFLFVLIFCFLTFSGILMPIESLSYLMQKLSLLNPYLISEGILRKIIIFESSFNSVAKPVIILSVLAILFFIINLVMESFSRKGKLFHYFLYIKLKIKEKIENGIEYLKTKFKKKTP